MLKFIFKRASSGVISLFVFSFFIFAMIEFSSGDIVHALYGDSLSALNPHTKELIISNLGLDKPFLQRYIKWLFDFVRGDFGYSLVSGQKVSDIVQSKLVYTLILGGSSFVLSFVLALILGVISGLYEDTWLDKLILIITLSFFSLPSFLLGILAIMIFGTMLGIFSSFYDLDSGYLSLVWQLSLPILVLSVSHLAIYTRLVRSSYIEALKEPFVVSFRSWGVGKGTIYFKLALRSALIPLVSYFGTHSASIITGTYIVESVFLVGGIGSATISSLLAKDYPLALSIILLSMVFVVVINFLVEIINMTINPKLKQNVI